MTRASLREYAAVQRKRYQEARRPEKHRLLDEMVAVTGMHRKAAIRLLRRRPRAGWRRSQIRENYWDRPINTGVNTDGSSR